ncbi:RNA polymerase Rpb4-domain-containing protein [Armillaria borealis]|uniref:DNA-directed RNA polymerase III subunit RPC9 n=1 Tax=Armillaria borealis TaxID=47425 RepID=A0AA39N2V3_9AGAR|nr:RNA polymerase Rpb4-domain-containing protein [Armillaria borealis]
MEVVNARSALLSNFEVLSLLRELESDHLARTKTALRIKKEEEAAGVISSIVPGEKHPSNVEVIHNLRTIEVEAIQYLSAEYQPTKSQTEQGITRLVKDLDKYALTKAEKLQVVNLVPTLPVELYVIVEELEDRLGESMEEILVNVQSSLSSTANTTTEMNSYPSTVHEELGSVNEEDTSFWDAEGDVDTEIQFDDRGEGVGVEGDLDVDDD